MPLVYSQEEELESPSNYRNCLISFQMFLSFIVVDVDAIDVWIWKLYVFGDKDLWWWRRSSVGEEWNIIMFSKACQQYFKLSRRLKIQLSFEENFKLTFHSLQINVFVFSQRLASRKFCTFHLILLNFNSRLPWNTKD